jgi:hypothetical protein
MAPDAFSASIEENRASSVADVAARLEQVGKPLSVILGAFRAKALSRLHEVPLLPTMFRWLSGPDRSTFAAARIASTRSAAL